MGQDGTNKARGQRKIELHAPPGMRFMNEYGGGVTLQFLEGEEEALFTYLQQWLDGQRVQHFNAKILILMDQPILTDTELQTMISESNAAGANAATVNQESVVDQQVRLQREAFEAGFRRGTEEGLRGQTQPPGPPDDTGENTAQ